MSAMASLITGVSTVYSPSVRFRSKNTSKLRVSGLCKKNSPVTGETPHKGPVTRKIFHLMTSSWLIVQYVRFILRTLTYNEKITHSDMYIYLNITLARQMVRNLHIFNVFGRGSCNIISSFCKYFYMYLFNTSVTFCFIQEYPSHIIKW